MEIKNKYVPKGVLCLDYECKYNSRKKYYLQPDGTLKLVEQMTCNRFIFNPDNVEENNREGRIKKEQWEELLAEEYGLRHYIPEPTDKKGNINRSKRRAKNKIMDIIKCNSFDWFCTLTLNPEIIQADNYNAVIKKLNTYLDNRVRRHGLTYVGVPELHKKGNIHFHFLCNGEGLKLIHSGTYIPPCGGKPRKEYTIKKRGFKLEDCKDVFNIQDWSFGWTTAIKTYGSKEAVANYIGKYITKGENKIGGRWYYSGGKLNKPIYTYERVSFDSFDSTYEFNCDGGNFKVKTFD